VTVDAEDGLDIGGAWQGAVDGWDAVGGDEVSVLAELVEEHAHGEHGADGVAIGTGMGADEEAVAGLDGSDDGGHGDGEAFACGKGCGERFADRDGFGAGHGQGAWVGLRLGSGGFLLGFGTFFDASEEVVDAGLELFGAVDVKGEVGDAADAEAIL